MKVLSGRRRTVSSAGTGLSEEQTRLVWRLAGLLLDYPGPATLASLDEWGRAAATLPAPAGPALLAFIDRTREAEPLALRTRYVETFDLRRRHSLHLTYFAYGDTRKRGMALLRFKHIYREADVELSDMELPDHLSVLLEFAAVVDPVAGRRLLLEYQPVLELLRRALHEVDPDYALLFDAIAATLPDLDAAARRRVVELATAGPPEEEVGLDPFAMDPALEEHLGADSKGGRR